MWENCTLLCVHHCAQLPYTKRHGTVDNLPSQPQTNIIAQMLSVWEECKQKVWKRSIRTCCSVMS